MLKSTSLGTYWQDNSSCGSSFTRVRCISNGAQVVPQIYGAWRKKNRAQSVPDASCKIFMRFRKKSSSVDDPTLISNDINTRKNTGEGTKTTLIKNSVRNSRKKTVKTKLIDNSNVDEEIEMPLENEVEPRLLVCTLDTEQSGGSESGEEAGSNEGERRGSRNHSRTNSVDMITARSTIQSFSSAQSCQGCGLCFEISDQVVVFEADPYHVQCFACGNCGLQVDPTNNFLVLDNGIPLCKLCSPTCHSCGEKIVYGHLNVLNKDFHEECLKCSICKKVFGTINKVYASGGEPCCAECVTPVFNEVWSPKRLMNLSPSSFPLNPAHLEDSESDFTAPGSQSLPPRLESLSQAVNELPTTRFHTLLRPSFSVPISLTNSPGSLRRGNSMSLSSLKAILCDELGVSLLMNFCMDDCSIELVVFWLDAEHFKHFDGNDDDIRLFAHHIMMKYIGYYAELPINLPSDIEDKITVGIQSCTCSQDLFDEAQAYILDKMERALHPKFLRSTDGQQFLEALVKRDIERRKMKRKLVLESQVLRPMKATVISFDKRYQDTKYYIYAVQVEEDGELAMIYRRYSDFHALHQALRLSVPALKLPLMPKKIFFGRSQTRGVASQRMKDLDAYLQGLLSLSVEQPSEILNRFLAQNPSDKADEAFDTRLKKQTVIN